MKDRCYHCPACVDERMYTQEGLRAHLDDCNPWSLMADDERSLTICNVLRGPEEEGGDAASTASGENDDNSIILCNDGIIDGKELHTEPSDGTMDEGHDDVATGNHLSDAGNGPPPGRLPRGVEDNLDYVSLPSVANSIDDDDDTSRNNDGDIARNEKPPLFGNIFWWQRLHALPARRDVAVGSRDALDDWLGAFGFKRPFGRGKDRTPLRYTRLLPSNDNAHATERGQIEEILLCARLVDLSSVCVHAGRDLFARSALDALHRSLSGNGPLQLSALLTEKREMMVDEAL